MDILIKKDTVVIWQKIALIPPNKACPKLFSIYGKMELVSAEFEYWKHQPTPNAGRLVITTNYHIFNFALNRLIMELADQWIRRQQPTPI